MKYSVRGEEGRDLRARRRERILRAESGSVCSWKGTCICISTRRHRIERRRFPRCRGPMGGRPNGTFRRDFELRYSLSSLRVQGMDVVREGGWVMLMWNLRWVSKLELDYLQPWWCFQLWRPARQWFEAVNLAEAFEYV